MKLLKQPQHVIFDMDDMCIRGRLWMGQGPVFTDAHAPCLPSLFRGLPRADHSRATRSAGSVQTSGGHRGACQQAGLFRCFFGHAAHHLVAGHNLFRNLIRRQAQFRCQDRVPEQIVEMCIRDS